MTVPDHLFIRADASTRIGTGHVMRMIALAQAYQDRGGPVTMACATCPESVAQRVCHEEIACERLENCEPGSQTDWQHTIARAKSLGARWVVLDGYHFDLTYQRALREAGLRVLAVDDYGHCETWAADAVLNQNIFAPELKYQSEVEGCQFLLGTRFALLRREFRQAAGSHRFEAPDESCRRRREESHSVCVERDQSLLASAPTVQETPRPIHRLLVTLGGADPDNVTGRLLSTLNLLAEFRLEIKALVGGGNPHLEYLRQLTAASPHSIEVLHHVLDMPALYRWADGIISAGGSTCWEWLFYRLPAAVVCIADNQRPVIAGLVKHQLAMDLGWHENLDPTFVSAKLRGWLKCAGKHRPKPPANLAVDALGADRVATVLDGTHVWLRRASAGDAQLWFQWANDPAVRANGFHPDPVTWEVHQKWFEHHRLSPDSRLWIGFDILDKPMGYVRLHRRDNAAWEIGVAVDAAARNRGMGLRLVKLALQQFARENESATILARIKPANAASLKLFRAAGFADDSTRANPDCCVLVCKLINII